MRKPVPHSLPLFNLPNGAPSVVGSAEGWLQHAARELQFETGPAWPDRFGLAIRKWAQDHVSPISTLSLFSGGGGLDIAFHDAGFKIVEMVEVEERYATTLQVNAREGGSLGSARVTCADIRNYNPKDVEVQLVVGGPPCQTFSAAGRRAAGVKGINDERGTLFEEYARLLQQLRPRAFLFENVYGLTGAQNGSAWRAIHLKFTQLGYRLFWRVLDTADYGVPQHRERLFIIGVLSGDYLFPCPTHGPDAHPSQPFYTAGEAVLGANEQVTDDISLTGTAIGGRFSHLIADIPPGLNYSFFTPEMGHPRPVFAWRSKFSDFMYKADPEAPVRTIKAQAGLYTGPFSWENRHFTVAEMKRLQTFPDNYILTGNRSTKLEQIGNSVPPQIGRVLALSILQQVFNTRLPIELQYLQPHKALGFRQRKRLLTQHYSRKAQLAIQQRELLTKSEQEFSIPEQWRVVEKFEPRLLTSRFELREPDKNQALKDGSLLVALSFQEHSEFLFVKGKPLTAFARASDTTEMTYEIIIRPTPAAYWPMTWTEARMQGSQQEPLLFTALWKAFEEWVNVHYNIADLVQLRGYYQYTPRILATMRFDSPGNIECQWRVVALIVSGEGVGKQFSTAALATLWGVKSSEVLNLLHFMRKLGYEVRSHRTNPQIQEGQYLIPYAFPTLSTRSIQGRKEL